MIEVISTILGVIKEIVRISDEMEEAGTQASRLARRLVELERPLGKLKRSVDEEKYLPHEKNLRRLESLVKEAKVFLIDFKGRNLFRRVMNRQSDLETFVTLTNELKDVVHIFNFSLNVHVWEQESEKDREDDLKRLLHIEKMLEEHTEKVVEEQRIEFRRAAEEIIGGQNKMYLEQKRMYQEFKNYLGRRRTVDRRIGQASAVRMGLLICHSSFSGSVVRPASRDLICFLTRRMMTKGLSCSRSGSASLWST